MCGCGIDRWCAGGCDCGCNHATLEGQTDQARHFALQYADVTQRAADAYGRGERAAAQPEGESHGNV